MTQRFVLLKPKKTKQTGSTLFCRFFPIFPEMVPTEVQGELKHLYAAAGELLRHFWSCFPVNTPFLEEKVTNILCVEIVCVTQ